MRRRPAGAWAGFLQALRYAFAGLHYAVRTQRTFRTQLVCAAGIAAVAVWLHLSPLEAAVVGLALFGVLAAELFNTGVEAIVDLLVEHNHHELARIAKDIAAAGVIVTILGAVLAGGLILGPPLAVRLGTTPAWAGRLAWAGALAILLGAAVGLLSFLRRPSADEPKGARRHAS